MVLWWVAGWTLGKLANLAWVQSRVTTDLVCAMVCAAEGNGQQKRGRPWEFDLRFGLRLVCALVCARHTGRSANQINPE